MGDWDTNFVYKKIKSSKLTAATDSSVSSTGCQTDVYVSMFPTPDIVPRHRYILPVYILHVN